MFFFKSSRVRWVWSSLDGSSVISSRWGMVRWLGWLIMIEHLNLIFTDEICQSWARLFCHEYLGMIFLTQTYFGFQCLLAVQEMQALGRFFFCGVPLRGMTIPYCIRIPDLSVEDPTMVSARKCVPGSNILGVGWHLLWPRHASRAFFLLGAVNGWFRPGQLPRSRWEHFLDVQMCMSQSYSVFTHG